MNRSVPLRRGGGQRSGPRPRRCTTLTATSDYDAIVIGAGHNGLTASVVMARGGMRVLCLEKNHFVGGMASTNELVRGYRFELAGSIQFRIPTQIFDDLGFDTCPIYEPEVQSAALGPSRQPPLLLYSSTALQLYSDPDRLVEHLSDALGLEAVLGMAEVAGWAEGPARAIGRFDVRSHRSHSTRCGPALPTSRSARRSAPPCPAA